MTRARICLLLAAPVLVFGCGRNSTPPPREPAPDGLPDWTTAPLVSPEEQTIPRLRLLSLAPSATEICCALGLQDQLVARTRFCQHPASIEVLPEVGDVDDINPEALLALKPDLVFVSGVSRAVSDRLTALRVRFEALPDRTLDDVFVAIERIGALTGRPRTAAQLCGELERELNAVAAAYPAASPQRVLILLGVLADPPAPPFAAGPGSFYDDLLRRAGHANALAAEGRAYGPLSLESIVRIDPDVIIELDADGTGRPGGNAQALRVWSRLGNLKAVVSRRVYVLTGKQHHIPGPRIARAFAELCRTLAGGSHE